MLKKTQVVVRRGEALADAAKEFADATKGADPLGVTGLSPATMATERAALHQAATYERWAGDAMSVDPLLGRALMDLSRQLRAVAERATRVRGEAADALEALEGEDSEPS
jgi:sugar/nucleoside kinase (ribokinase family)